MWKDFQYVTFHFSMLAIKLLKKMTPFYAIFLCCFFFVFLKLIAAGHYSHSLYGKDLLWWSMEEGTSNGFRYEYITAELFL